MKKNSLSPFRITAVYVFISANWIHWSDRWVGGLSPDAATATYFQTWKGWFFVLVTAVLLYFLMNRMLQALRESEQKLRTVLEGLEQRVEDRTRELVYFQKQLHQLVLEQTQMELKDRKRLADVLHDNVQQMLAACILRLNRICERTWNRESKEQIAEALAILDGALGATRLISNELRPPVLLEIGFASSLNWLANDLKKRHGIEVSLELDESVKELPEALGVLLFRLVRVLLNNVAQYAYTDRAWLTLSRVQPDSICIRVADKGIGFCVTDWQDSLKSGKGYGLFGLKEIVHSMGGSLEIRSEPGKGTVVEFSVPIEDRAIQADGNGNRAEEIPLSCLASGVSCGLSSAPQDRESPVEERKLSPLGPYGRNRRLVK